MPAPDDHLWVIPPRYWRWAGTRRAVVVFLWLAAVAAGGHRLWHAWTAFEEVSPKAELNRVDGNSGHTQIDFGGQWVIARTLALGYPRELYHRQRLWRVAEAGYRRDGEPPRVRDEFPRHLRQYGKPSDEIRHDAEALMLWFMGDGKDAKEWRTVAAAAALPVAAAPPAALAPAVAALVAAGHDAVTPAVAAAATKPAIGGPLYPPVHPFFYLPVGLIDDPQLAYRLFQFVALGLAYLAGLAVCVLSRGRVWWSAASLVILLYPGCRGGVDLGQNPTLSLCVVLWGWVLAARGRPAAGGVVWGLFAFKPVWAASFLMVALITGRWRMAAAMAVTGATLVLATVPVVGVQTWFDWLEVGKEAADLYAVNLNWVSLSRDLFGVPRRFLIDFDQPEEKRGSALAAGLGWGVWAAVLVATVVVYRRKADRARYVGVGAAFALLAAYLLCYRFMYYDALLSAAGVAALVAADPWRFLRTRTFTLTPTTPPPPWPDRRLDPPPALPPARFAPRHLGYVASFPLTVLGLMLVVENSLIGTKLEGTFGVGYWARATGTGDAATAFATPVLKVDTGVNYPCDTLLALALWAWCGWRLLCGEERPKPDPKP